MLVKDLMTSSVSAVRPDDVIETAVKIMRGENIGIVPVCDIQKHVLGVVTDRDILMRSVSAGFSSSDIQSLPQCQVMN